MAKNKATHSGHCQCCGRNQKLPGGVIAKHGYEVAGWGFFNGVCQGAGELPFEQSCELVKKFVQWARDRRQGVLDRQAELRKPATEAVAWVSVYCNVPGDRRGRKAYHWMELPITTQDHQTIDGSYKWTTYHHPLQPGQLPSTRGLEFYGKEKGKTLLEVCTMLNAKYAESMDRTIKEIYAYIEWQQKRVTNWKPAPLTPVK